MKKTLVLLMALSSAVAFAAPAGQDVATDRGAADLMGTSAEWYSYNSSPTVTSNSISFGASWGDPVAWALFNEDITLTEKDTLTLSFTATTGSLADGVFCVVLQGNAGETAVLIGDKAYKDSSLSAASATLATTGYHWPAAQTLAFDKGNSADRFQEVAPAITLGSVTPGLDVTATISHNGTQFVMDLTAGEQTKQLELGDSLHFDSLVFRTSGGVEQTISNIKLTVVPEPATATLSLLALAGLAARRRRH